MAHHNSLAIPQAFWKLPDVTHLKVKRYCIAVNGSIPWHSYGVSLAIWDHTVLLTWGYLEIVYFKLIKEII